MILADPPPQLRVVGAEQGKRKTTRGLSLMPGVADVRDIRARCYRPSPPGIKRVLREHGAGTVTSATLPR